MSERHSEWSSPENIYLRWRIGIGMPMIMSIKNNPVLEDQNPNHMVMTKEVPGSSELQGPHGGDWMGD